MRTVTLFTIGFTRTGAEAFFTLLRDAGVKRVLDIRLNASSQLAGFAKSENLRFFLKAICDIEYVPVPELAPTKEMLESYRGGAGDWAEYERRYRALLEERKAIEVISREMLDGCCLLCSEHEPERCHRRLAAEYFLERLGNIEIVHLL